MSPAVGGILALAVACLLGAVVVYAATRGVRALEKAILGKNPSFAFEFASDRTPEDAVGELVIPLVPEFGAFGYPLREHAAGTVVLERSFTPRAAYGIPLLLAVLAFAAGVASNSSHTAQRAGAVAAILVGVAIALSLFVKRTERVSVNARASTSGTLVTVAGSATPEFQRYLKANLLPSQPDRDSPDAQEREALDILRDSVARERRGNGAPVDAPDRQ